LAGDYLNEDRRGRKLPWRGFKLLLISYILVRTYSLFQEMF
jgi:hypothetical protein